MILARLVELVYSRHNIQTSGEVEEGRWSRRTFPLVATVHGAVIAGTLFFGRSLHLPWLLLLGLLQPLRIWVLRTLGRRWNARGAVPKDMVLARHGPYAFVRHPNYTVVALELLSLPLAFGLPRLAALAFVANAFLLAVRVRDEERLLSHLPGYTEHFGRKPRFLPGLF